jgi:glycosyltransferase involved in cell wall biosynthesis
MLRNYHLARELARGGARVTYLCFSEETDAARSAVSSAASESDDDGVENPERFCERVISVPRRRGYTPLKLARGAFGPTPVTVLNYTTAEMATELARLLEEQDFDVVQVESIHLAAYLPVIRAARRRPRVLLDWHNVESEIMARYAERANGLLRRAYARRTARQLARLEACALKDFDAHLTVSERDRDQLIGVDADARVHVVENGVATERFTDEKVERAHAAWLAKDEGARECHAATHTSETIHASEMTHASETTHASEATPTSEAARRVVFVGSMDYHANVDAVVSFARETWPQLKARVPGLVFSIVGREPAPEVRALAALPGVDVTGTVEDVRPYYAEALAAVIPLRVGGGSRLKILEAMAAGVPVVSTRLGAEGIDARDGAEIILADTSEELCGSVERLASDEDLRRSLVAAGRALVCARYDWSSVGATLLKIYEEMLGE